MTAVMPWAASAQAIDSEYSRRYGAGGLITPDALEKLGEIDDGEFTLDDDGNLVKESVASGELEESLPVRLQEALPDEVATETVVPEPAPREPLVTNTEDNLYPDVNSNEVPVPELPDPIDSASETVDDVEQKANALADALLEDIESVLPDAVVADEVPLIEATDIVDDPSAADDADMVIVDDIFKPEDSEQAEVEPLVAEPVDAADADAAMPAEDMIEPSVVAEENNIPVIEPIDTLVEPLPQQMATPDITDEPPMPLEALPEIAAPVDVPPSADAEVDAPPAVDVVMPEPSAPDEVTPPIAMESAGESSNESPTEIPPQEVPLATDTISPPIEPLEATPTPVESQQAAPDVKPVEPKSVVVPAQEPAQLVAPAQPATQPPAKPAVNPDSTFADLFRDELGTEAIPEVKETVNADEDRHFKIEERASASVARPDEPQLPAYDLREEEARIYNRSLLTPRTNDILKLIDNSNPSFMPSRGNEDESSWPINIDRATAGRTFSEDGAGEKGTAAIAFGATPDEFEREKELLNLAYEALIFGQMESAIRLYRTVLNDSPKHKLALFGLATAYQRNNQAEQAKQTYRVIFAHYPDYPEAFNNFLVLLSEESPDAALVQMEELQKKYPRVAAIAAQIGMIHLNQERYQLAAMKLARAVTLSPENISFRYNLAVAMDSMGEHEEAARLYEQVLSADAPSLPTSASDIQKRLTFLRAHR